ncbi:hypothetical protein K503DRAFT_348177 [Rhizopogon vinicolor AM-OR11-026]|uniref:Uncharacterized protein n=1 Tax=Rhizopogon vinicolor AM-OR11-026 TaxID=1314800 RepID=A0A1B7NCG0_9AGAM|nr:hypothetical protein K503DRAFT_348177 [Rhizopogon vinicolor AM-OR11-026]
MQTQSRRTREATTGCGIDRHSLEPKLKLEELPPDTSTSTSSSLDSPSPSGSSSPTHTSATPTHSPSLH